MHDGYTHTSLREAPHAHTAEEKQGAKWTWPLKETETKTCSSLCAYNKLAAERQVSSLESHNSQSSHSGRGHFPSAGCNRPSRIKIISEPCWRLPLIFPLLNERKNCYLMSGVQSVASRSAQLSLYICIFIFFLLQTSLCYHKKHSL